MAMGYEEVQGQLFQAAHERFVAERKRLAGELKAAGDKAGAARLASLNRPPISAWVVNQLWRRAQSSFEQLFAAAARQRAGDREAAGAHRQKLAELRARAAELLQAAGHPATESTLRRVTMTLAALAAAGDFAPDSPGALTADRDPPGFETVAGGAFEPSPEPARERSAAKRSASGTEAQQLERRQTREQDHAKQQAEREQAEREQAEREQAEREQAEREQAQAERARREAEEKRLKADLQAARAGFETRTRAAAQQREALTVAEQALVEATAVMAAAAARLAAFEAEVEGEE